MKAFMTGKKSTKGENEVEILLDDVSGILDTHLPDPQMLEYYRRLNRREIVWNDVIDESTLDIALYIEKWNVEDKGVLPCDRTPIRILINSDGGCLNSVMHIADIIALSKTPVITIGMGKVYSAGGLLLMAGHKRIIFPSTSCLIHDGYSGSYGTVGKQIDNLKFTERQEALVKNYILSRTKIPSDLYDENYRRDWYMFSDEMIQYGVADEIETDLDMIF